MRKNNVKKLIASLLLFALTLTLAACAGTSREEGQQAQPENSDSSISPSASPQQSQNDSEGLQGNGESQSNILVAYFSWADNAVIEGEVDAVSSPSVVAPGNVEQLAGWVQEATGGDLFSIQVLEPYSSDWDECLERANTERAEDARPDLTAGVENMNEYDTIFLGYPNWWYGAPMAVLSFLEDYDFSGKQVYLFCSHGTGGLASSVEDIREAMQGGNISENIFDVYEEDAASSQNDIENWLTELGY